MDAQKNNKENPCNSNCAIQGSGFCSGCGRSLSDIAEWANLDGAARLTRSRAAKARLAWAANDGRLGAIMAIGPSGAVGKGADLPWRLPSELAWFKEATAGKALILGRPTWNGMPGSLPGRLVAVVGSSAPERMEKLGERGIWVPSVDDALAWAKQQGRGACLGGGPTLWKSSWHLVQKAWITRIEGPIEEADAFFEPDLQEFNLAAQGPSWFEGPWRWRSELWERQQPASI